MQWYLDLEPAVVGVGCGPMVSLDAELWYVVEVICCCPVAQSTTCSDTWSGRNFRRAYNLNYALYVVETVNSQLWYVVEGVYWWSMDYLYVGLIHWCLLVFHEVLVCGTHSFQHWTVIDTWWKVYWCSMKYLCVGLTHSWLIHSNTEPSSPVRVTALAIAVLIVAVRGRGPGYCGVVNWSITVKLKLESDCHEWNFTY